MDAATKQKKQHKCTDQKPNQAKIIAPYQGVIFNQVLPQIDEGQYSIKRCLLESVTVSANIFRLPEDVIFVDLLYRHEHETVWQRRAMAPLGNDRWEASFTVQKLGYYHYTLQAWISEFQRWRGLFEKKYRAKEKNTVEWQQGLMLLEARIAQYHCTELIDVLNDLHAQKTFEQQAEMILSDKLAKLMEQFPDQKMINDYPKKLAVWVDRPKAGFSSWYEIFPRSCGPNAQTHGTFKDLINKLPYIAQMGFDVLYLPPIHPIGCNYRKGKNNTLTATPDDPGSPWAIGAAEGGHTAIHPQLGDFEDFAALIKAAQKHGIEVALDIALQCSPDHPFVHEHPEWFLHRPDGTIQYAENFPKKYQDIYPLHFHCDAWPSLWQACLDIFLFWINKGIKIFRIDNPHTKPFAFWAWLIPEIRQHYPDVLFLAEAFTRMQIMYQLAKIGFTQSYTYFTWRHTKEEITRYIRELNETELREYFRPNFWPNTPDILTHALQEGGRAHFMTRFILAATLSSNYGIYGPAYELCVSEGFSKENEEYSNSEKYEIKHWPMNHPDSLAPLIGQINAIRQQNLALQEAGNIVFHETDNEQILCYSRVSRDRYNRLLIIVNLDPCHEQLGFIYLSLDALHFKKEAACRFQVKDLLNHETYTWANSKNYVALSAKKQQAHIFLITE